GKSPASGGGRQESGPVVASSSPPSVSPSTAIPPSGGGATPAPASVEPGGAGLPTSLSPSLSSPTVPSLPDPSDVPLASQPGEAAAAVLSAPESIAPAEAAMLPPHANQPHKAGMPASDRTVSARR